MLLRYEGNSGISMLKLDENRNELAQSNQNFKLYIGPWLFAIMWQVEIKGAKVTRYGEQRFCQELTR
jgi:hypothetical protein